jgi:cell division septation protein DedD
MEAALTPLSQPSSQASNETKGWVVQLSAQRTEAEAQSAFRAAQTKYSMLAGYQLKIRKKVQGERGVFYATQLGPLSRDEANQLCSKLKNAGGSCFIQGN